MMAIEHIPDWDKRVARFDAFWDRAVIDRPHIMLCDQKKNPTYPCPPEKQYKSHRDRWMDFEYIAEKSLAYVMNNAYYGDALPQVVPNLGPEVFSAFFGCEMEYGEITSWSIPMLKDWADMDRIKFSEENPYWKKVLEFTDILMEVGAGKFYTSLTDFHPGGDAIAAFRGPEELAVDLIDSVDQVKELLAYVNEVYLKVLDFYFDKLYGAGHLPCSFMFGASSKRWYWVSNDFSCMISKQMFEEIFLPGIIEECRHMERSMYHLDGPTALRHLDSILQIEELDAVQWQYGAGNGQFSDWIDVYKKCQAAGKGIQIYPYLDEIDLMMETLRPEGVQICPQLREPLDEETAEAVIRKVSTWK